MNARKLMYIGIAAIGIAGLGAYAYYAQRAPVKPVEQSGAAAPASAASAKGGNGTVAAGNVPAAVDVAKVVSAKLVEDLNSVGTIRSNESVMMRPEVAGRITRLNFGDGQKVGKGQVLVAFDSTVNQAEVQQARAELGIAKSNFSRNE
ncbi:MAG: putative HlyD-like secretion protein, partial [Herminiimonas sp.]|nr:putative HlyD-like secretion protein [Herminiimonas sp.]